MPALRGHHLICLHFFHGEGYDDAFVANLKKTLSPDLGEYMSISSGADDICACCPSLEEGRCRHTENAEEEIRKMDSKALALLGFSYADKVKWEALREGMNDIFSEWFFLYCTECNWKSACEKSSFFRKLKINL